MCQWTAKVIFGENETIQQAKEKNKNGKSREKHTSSDRTLRMRQRLYQNCVKARAYGA